MKTDKKAAENVDFTLDDQLVDFISNISEVIKKKNLTRVKLKIDEMTLEVENKEPVSKVVGAAALPYPAAAVAPPMVEAAPAEPAAEAEDGFEEIVSPIIGTYYSAPAPSEPPFVKVGDQVEPGKTLCIVEAMKVMNKINSKCQGRVHSIEVKNGQLVQTGQVLIRIKP